MSMAEKLDKKEIKARVKQLTKERAAVIASGEEEVTIKAEEYTHLLKMVTSFYNFLLRIK